MIRKRKNLMHCFNKILAEEVNERYFGLSWSKRAAEVRQGYEKILLVGLMRYVAGQGWAFWGDACNEEIILISVNDFSELIPSIVMARVLLLTLPKMSLATCLARHLIREHTENSALQKFRHPFCPFCTRWLIQVCFIPSLLKYH